MLGFIYGASDLVYGKHDLFYATDNDDKVPEVLLADYEFHMSLSVNALWVLIVFQCLLDQFIMCKHFKL